VRFRAGILLCIFYPEDGSNIVSETSVDVELVTAKSRRSGGMDPPLLTAALVGDERLNSLSVFLTG
jgi:hypothetical protein